MRSADYSGVNQVRILGVIALVTAVWSCSAPQPGNTGIRSHSQSAQDVAAEVELMVEQFGVSAAEVTPDVSLKALGADELDIIEVIMAVEDRFRVEITDELIARHVDGAGNEDQLTARKLAALVAESRSIGRGATQ
jgi:acyl carrier protein